MFYSERMNLAEEKNNIVYNVHRNKSNPPNSKCFFFFQVKSYTGYCISWCTKINYIILSSEHTKAKMPTSGDLISGDSLLQSPCYANIRDQGPPITKNQPSPQFLTWELLKRITEVSHVVSTSTFAFMNFTFNHVMVDGFPRRNCLSHSPCYGVMGRAWEISDKKY